MFIYSGSILPAHPPQKFLQTYLMYLVAFGFNVNLGSFCKISLNCFSIILKSFYLFLKHEKK